MSHQTCFPIGFETSGKFTAWHFNSLIIPGDQTKNIRHLMAP